MISVNNLSISFTGTYLFDDVSFIVNDRDRIGLVGKNGAGKSTLLKILSGLQEAEKGTFVKPNDTTIGYLPQELKNKSNKTILNEALSAFVEAKDLESKIKHYTSEISKRTDYESDAYYQIIHQLTDANERFQIIGGHTMQADAERVLIGLGFTQNDFERPISEFSGGWQMRVELAKILLQKPDVLLLDEPTNHLDIESIQWLEDFLIGYFGAVVLVSHDRAFLDNITQRTIEISLGKIYDFKACYSDYLILRAEGREQQMATYNNQQKQIQDIEKFITRFRAQATKAKQVQSRIKLLDKIDRVEVEAIDSSAIHFRFPPAPHCGKVMVEAENLSKAYGNKKVLSNLTFLVNKGERVALVGKNGEGKTTLSRIIIKDLDYEGSCKLGHNVSVGYYAQNQADLLNPDKTVFETIDDIAVGEIRTKIRNILGSFLFGAEAIDKKVKVLSGGEKSRLALAKLLLTPVNLLVLDEPTNHLDMQSKDILKNALNKYDGTLIIVSHDRDFLQGLTNKVYEFKNQKIKEYIGDIYNFLQSRKMESLKQLEKKTNDNLKVAVSGESQNKVNREKRKLFEKELRKIETQIERSEKEIDRLEKEIKAIDDILLNPETYKEALKSKDFYSNYEELKGQLEKEMQIWEELNSKADELKNSEI
ncbi:MAG: ABC-F family ATP-binding cassette domain-containing protein [Bacteroidetes bacterium]|nr:ABC-F family ATP-binding cassette domain-containing protein [Bacteroidota bacterium]